MKTEINIKSPCSGLVLGGRYELEDLVDRGYLGDIWKAKDVQVNLDRAIRFIPKEIFNFRNEMRRIRAKFEKVSKLKHPAICSFYSMEEDPEYGCYLVMDWITGVSLENYLSSEKFPAGRIPKNTILAILRSVSEALDHAHDQKVIHRDLNPKSILLKKDVNGEVVGTSLINFGIGAELQEITTRISQSSINVTGIPSYMSPEQWQNRQQDGRSDQYSLAAIAYELFSGRLPFSGKSVEVLRESVLNDEPQKITDVDNNINRVLQKALSKTPGKRFKTCTEFIDALESPSSVAKWFYVLIGLTSVIIAAIILWKIFG